MTRPEFVGGRGGGGEVEREEIPERMLHPATHVQEHTLQCTHLKIKIWIHGFWIHGVYQIDDCL